MTSNLVRFQPAVGSRVDLTLDAGLTLYEIVLAALPGALSSHLDRVTVELVTDKGRAVIKREYWDCVRPHPGVCVIVTLVHGLDSLGSILQAVVTIAGALIGGPLGLIFTIAGTLLINALIPPPSAPEAPKPVYSIGGWRNRMAPDAPVPNILGKVRYAPPFAVMSHSEVINGLQYSRVMLCLGYGPLKISDVRIGDTPVTDYDEVDIQIREGRAGDAPITLIPNQIIEEVIQVELTRPLPRDAAGDIIEDLPGESKPVSRFTATDVSKISIILFFQNGLVHFDKKGRSKPLDVTIAVRMRRVGVSEWTTVETLAFENDERRPFFNQYTWSVPTRGRYEVEVERMTDERTESTDVDRVTWAVIQSIRPEYGVNFNKPLALIGLRVKATYQLNGQLETVNALCSRECLDWNAATNSWVQRETRNPAALFRLALQGPANPYPVSDAEIDLAAIADWHEFCTAKGLHYDHVHDFEGSVYDALKMIAAAGRAQPRFDGLKWTVIIDRPQTFVVDHVNPRNSDQFTWSVPYFKPPHALRVQFLDETNDYQPAERIVRWPGYTGDVTDTQEISLPGKTNPDEVWREARRRMYEMIYRQKSYSFRQYGAARPATRGDLVMGSWDVLSATQYQARVLQVMDRLIELDDDVEMVEGETYAVRFRNGTSSAVREVITRPGRTNIIYLKEDSAAMPPVDEVVHFGPLASESTALIIAEVEPQDTETVLYRALPAAPEIDDVLATDIPPAWSGRVGAEIDDGNPMPAVPRFKSVLTGVSGAGVANRIKVILAAGSGGAAASATFEVSYRLFGSSSWTIVNVSAATGAVNIDAYAVGDVVQLRARAKSASGTPGGFTSTISVTVGSSDGSAPAELPDTISIVGGLGSATIAFTTGSTAPAQVQIYRAATTTLSRETDALGDPIAVAASSSYSRSDGDITRRNLLLNPGFSSGSAWTAGSGWAIAAGEATKAAGTASDLSQALAATDGKYYRFAASVDLAAGELTPKLKGTGVDVSAAPISAAGRAVGRLLANAGTDSLAFSADAAFAGALDDVVLYQESASCLPQGTLYYWLEPQNDNGIPGPLSGPFAVTIT